MPTCVCEWVCSICGSVSDNEHLANICEDSHTRLSDFKLLDISYTYNSREIPSTITLENTKTQEILIYTRGVKQKSVDK